MRRKTIETCLVAFLGLFASRAANAGPPLICQPIEIGDANSLPWDGGAWGARAGVTPAQVVDETLRILDSKTLVLVRMETMRRASVYLAGLRGYSDLSAGSRDRGARGSETRRDRDAAATRLDTLNRRAEDAAKAGRIDALAFFDAGYLSEAYSQAGLPENLNGYSMVKRALEFHDRDPEMSFAAALFCIHPKRPEREKYFADAARGAGKGTLLERNLDLTVKRWELGSVAELRARYNGPAR